MNRNLRRKLERENRGAELTLDKLPPKQKELLYAMIDNKAKEIAFKNADNVIAHKVELFAEDFDRNFSAVLLDLGYSLGEIDYIYGLVFASMKEDISKFAQHKAKYHNENGGLNEMGKQITETICNEIKDLILQGKKQSEVIKEIYWKYKKGYSQAMIKNAYAKVKSILDKEKEERADMEVVETLADIVMGNAIDPKEVPEEVKSKLEKKIDIKDIARVQGEINKERRELEKIEARAEGIMEAPEEEEEIKTTTLADIDMNKEMETINKQQEACENRINELIEEAKEKKEEVEVNMEGLKVTGVMLNVEGKNGKYVVTDKSVTINRSENVAMYMSLEDVEKEFEELKQVFALQQQYKA